MEFIHPELIDALKQHQAVFAEKIAIAMSAERETPLKVEAADVCTVKTADLYEGLGVPLVAVQFGFAEIAEHPQVFLIKDDSTLLLAGYARGEKVEEIDENLVAEVRPLLEAIVQGVCLAAGQVRSEPAVATNLSIRHQVFSFPPNLQRMEELIRIEFTYGIEEQTGRITWLLDPETASAILVAPSNAETDQMPFLQLEEGGGAPKAEDANGLELLMDIPLEISVELGRVKMLVKEVVDLGTGSIVELDKTAGEPVDVMVNGRVVAKGEVVVIEDNFGVRITEILTPHERLVRLSEVA